jgi:hypothetical protein
MRPLARLSARDAELLQTLAQRVRLLSLVQVARTWWHGSKRPEVDAIRRLRTLAAAGLVTLEEYLAAPELAQDEPLATWQPGLSSPDLPAVARACARRAAVSAVVTLCACATALAATHYGGRAGHPPRDTEISHDLHLAHVYLLMCEELPTRAATWQMEDVIFPGRCEPGAKRPDALVSDGLHNTAIESAGAYDRPKLEAFHRYCEEARLGYELW